MKAAHNIFYAHGFGNVAPWFDLANSEEWDGFGKRTDHLNDREWLAAFWKHWKLAPISFDSPSRRRLQDLRELLRRAAQKLAAGHSLGTGEITKLNHALNEPLPHRYVESVIQFCDFTGAQRVSRAKMGGGQNCFQY